jgi:hypothetical protein
MNAFRIVFRTSRFNLSKVGGHFINPCCFGEDVAIWLRAKLAERSVKARESYQEDWGWELPVAYGDDSYYLCIGGNSDELRGNPDEGEWGIIVEKKRSIKQRLTGKGKIAVTDEMAKIIEEILGTEPAIRDVRREE